MAVKLEVKVVKKVTIPTDFTLGKPFYAKTVEYLFRDVNGRIAKQQKADGTPIKRNAESTLAQKRRYGLKPISLVGFGLLAKNYKGSKGLQRSDHHFVGKAAYHQFYDSHSAVLSISKDAERIARELDKMGYAVDEVIAISEPAQKRIFNLATVSLRHMMRSAVKRGGR